MSRTYNTNPAMQVKNISPHAIGKGGSGGGGRRDTPLSAGGQAKPVSKGQTAKASNWSTKKQESAI